MFRKLGFTLLELLITIAILSVFLSLSTPSLEKLANKSAADRVAKKLVDAIEIARSEAITRNQIVTLCRSRSAEKCGGNWQDGIMVFLDENGDHIFDQEDRLLHYLSFLNIAGEIKWRAFQNRQYLQFTHQGFTRYQNGNFTYCPANGDAKYARQVIINRTGRVRLAIDSDGDGFKEDSQGRAIQCR